MVDTNKGIDERANMLASRAEELMASGAAEVARLLPTMPTTVTD